VVVAAFPTTTEEGTTMKAIVSILLSTLAFTAGAAPSGAIKNVVLVHGSFADGSGWRGVAEILEHDGYHVSVVQHPETSLDDDITAVKRVIAMQDGPVVLVGHSYGGVVVTGAGTDPKVAALVYVAAMLPDEGESAGQLLQSKPSASTAVTPTADGYLYLDPARFRADFAADLPVAVTRFMALSQVMTNGAAFGAKMTNPAWKTRPSWAIVATEDRAINPELELFMYKRAGARVIEVKSSHAVYISHPKETAALIEQAATGK
jgi:pimeloyl-ACP methyl ester carboxylesterase